MDPRLARAGSEHRRLLRTGWTATSPFDWHRYWFKHLREEGSTVLFPAYQEGASGDVEALTIDPLRVGLQRGFRELGAKDLPVIAAGFSFGGTLAFVYASFAERWGLPVPEAVYSIFPVGQIDALGMPIVFPRARWKSSSSPATRTRLSEPTAQRFSSNGWRITQMS